MGMGWGMGGFGGIGGLVVILIIVSVVVFAMRRRNSLSELSSPIRN